MRSKFIKALLLMAAIVPFVWFGLFLAAGNSRAVYAQHSATPTPSVTPTPSPTATPTPSPTATPVIYINRTPCASSDSQVCSAVVSAQGAEMGAIIAAIIAGIVALVGFVVTLFARRSTVKAAEITGQSYIKAAEVKVSDDVKNALTETIAQTKKDLNNEIDKLRKMLSDLLAEEQSQQQQAQDVLTAAIHAAEVKHREAMTQLSKLVDVYIPLWMRKGELLYSALYGTSNPSWIIKQKMRDPVALLRIMQRSLEYRIEHGLEYYLKHVNAADTSYPPNTVLNLKEGDPLRLDTYALLVLGYPGTGKTTLLKYLCRTSLRGQLTVSNSADPNPGSINLPFYIPLQDFASWLKQSNRSNHPKDALIDFIVSDWINNYNLPRDDNSKKKIFEYIQNKLETGEVLLLLDAMDRTVIGGTDEIYNNMVKSVNILANDYQKSLIVVTARDGSYRHGPKPQLEFATHWVLEDFCPEDIELFVEQWFTSSQLAATQLNHFFEYNSRIQALAANRRLLKVIVGMYANQEFPLSCHHDELYEQCVKVMLDENESNDVHTLKFKSDRKRQLLESIAWYLHENKYHYLLYIDKLPDEITTPLGENSVDSKAILLEIIAESGIFRQLEPNKYGFFCISLEEYFAAQYAIHHDDVKDKLLSYYNHPWWEEVIVLYSSVDDHISSLMQKMGGINSDWLQDDPFYTKLILIARCFVSSSNASQQKPGLKRQVLSLLVAALVTTPYLFVQEQITRTLMELGVVKLDKAGLEQLLENIQAQAHMSNFERIDVVLSTLDDLPVVTALFPLLSDRRIDANNRKAIANWDSTDKILGAQKLLMEDSVERSVRIRIAHALGALGDRSLVPTFLEALADKKIDRHIGRGFAYALGMLGDRTDGVTSKLLQLLYRSETDQHVGWSIVNALGTLATLGKRSLVAKLQEAFSDPDMNQYIIWNIASTLGDLGAMNEERIYPSVAQWLNNHHAAQNVQPIVRSGIDAWIKQDEPPVINQLLKQLENRQSPLPADECERLSDALGQLANTMAIVERLTNLLRGSDTPDCICRTRWIIDRRARCMA